MRTRRLIAVIFTAALLLSGCTSLSLNGSDILAPPRAAGSRAELQKLIEEDAGGGYTLISPAAGEYKSGLILRDFDNDGTEEAVALYTAKDGSARLLTAAASGGKFRATGSCELSSANISGVSFADLDADGVDELIIGCDAGSPIARLSVCFIGGELIKTDIAEGFTGYVTGDFDGNSAADVLIFMPANVEATANAVLTVYSDGAFVEKSSCETDPDIAAFARLSYGMISDGLYGAYADGVNEDGEYTTQLIYYDPSSHSLVNPLLVYTGYSKTLRSSKILSADFDGDGVTEIPLCSLTEYAKDEDISQVCKAVVWCRFAPGQSALEPVSEAVLCDNMGFVLALKPDTLDTVTARCADKSSMTVYGIDDKDGKPVTGPPLITVKYYDKGKFDSETTAEAVLYESAAGVYTCILSDNSGYTYDEVKNSFMLTENI